MSLGHAAGVTTMITVGETGHRRLAEIEKVRAGVVEGLNYVSRIKALRNNFQTLRSLRNSPQS